MFCCFGQEPYEGMLCQNVFVIPDTSGLLLLLLLLLLLRGGGVPCAACGDEVRPCYGYPCNLTQALQVMSCSDSVSDSCLHYSY